MLIIKQVARAVAVFRPRSLETIVTSRSRRAAAGLYAFGDVIRRSEVQPPDKQSDVRVGDNLVFDRGLPGMTVSDWQEHHDVLKMVRNAQPAFRAL